MSIRRLFRPHSVVIEVLIAHGALGNVTRRKGTIEALIAHRAPAVEAVIRGRFRNRVRHRSAISEAYLLVGMYLNARSLTSGIALALAHRDYGSIAIRVDIEAVVTRLLNRERHVRSINLVNLPREQVANMDVQSALVKLDLDGIVVNVGERKAGLVAQTEHACA
jgi:hypothetical protein